MPKAAINTPEEFWTFVESSNPNGCWAWQRGKTTAGYGVFYMCGKEHHYAHIFAYEQTSGLPVPKKMGLEVCHTCDNPICCNPAHLFLGTHADNMRDMVAKGRKRVCSGERNPSAKLTELAVLSILQMHASGEYKQSELALKFGVSQFVISKIVNRLAWKHVTLETVKARAA